MYDILPGNCGVSQQVVFHTSDLPQAWFHCNIFLTCKEGAGILHMDVGATLPFPLALPKLAEDEEDDGTQCADQRHRHQETETVDQTLGGNHTESQLYATITFCMNTTLIFGLPL